jgi:competence protein ComEC
VAARWGGLALATAYALLAGWGVPAQRTVGCWRWWCCCARSGCAGRPLVLLAAGGGGDVGDPWALLQPGFWLLRGRGAADRPTRPGAPRPRQPGAGAGPGRAAQAALRTQAVATWGWRR